MSVVVKLAFFLAALAAVICTSTAAGAERVGRSLIELTGPDGPVRGRLELRTAGAAWLTDETGALHSLSLANVRSHRRVADRFVPLPTHRLARRFREEIGPDAAVFAIRRYLVVRHASRTPGTFGSKLEQTYAAVSGWFARRGVRLKEPEFPLIAIVHKDFGSFARAAAADGAAPNAAAVPRMLKGYYSPTSNRLRVWEPPGGASDASFERTLIHEAVHQIAFNGGLHHRTGGTPRWVAEGLATALEAPAFLSAAGSISPSDRANLTRLRDYRTRSHPPGALDDLVFGAGGDSLAGRDPLTFYAEAWAFSFFLMQTRGPQYGRYLQSIGQTTAASPDASADRKAAFVSAFGATPRRLRGEMDRYLAAL
ncbi:MAG: DUF1570 domain-containing protein [Planctomycetota bacterium]